MYFSISELVCMKVYSLLKNLNPSRDASPNFREIISHHHHIEWSLTGCSRPGVSNSQPPGHGPVPGRSPLGTGPHKRRWTTEWMSVSFVQNHPPYPPSPPLLPHTPQSTVPEELRTSVLDNCRCLFLTISFCPLYPILFHTVLYFLFILLRINRALVFQMRRWVFVLK